MIKRKHKGMKNVKRAYEVGEVSKSVPISKLIAFYKEKKHQKEMSDRFRCSI